MTSTGAARSGLGGQQRAKSFLALSFVLALLSALWLAALQYRSVDVIVRNEEEHRRRALEGALSRAAGSLGQELSRANSAFHLGSWSPEQAGTVLDAWKKLAPYSAIVRGAYWFGGKDASWPALTQLANEPVPGGRNRVSMEGLTEALRKRRRTPEPVSPELPELVEEPLGLVIGTPPELPGSFPSAPPAIDHQAPLAPLRGVFVVLDLQYIFRDLLPLLLQDELGYSESDYDLSVLRVRDGTLLSGGRPPGGRNAVNASVSIGLLPGCTGLMRSGTGMIGMGFLDRPVSPDLPGLLHPLLTAKTSDCPEMQHLPSQLALWNVTATPRSAAALKKFENRSLLVTSAAAVCLAGSLAMLVLLIVQAQHLARLQVEFVASVSHELRTPLGTIGVAGDNLSSGLVQNREDALQYGKVIQAETRRLAHLVEQVLSYARALSRRWQPCCASLTVDEIIELALSNSGSSLKSAGLAVQVEIGADVPRVHGDLHALSRCLQNLLDNCAKYASEGRFVFVRAAAACNKNRPEVHLSVEDRGLGIAVGERKRLFEPFVRGTHSKTNGISGFGLGLNIAKRIIEAHHGTIEAFEPEGGIGTGFLIRLPARSAIDEGEQ